jgi:hypothetical protein
MRCFYVLKKWSSAKLSLNRDLSLNKVSLNRDCTVRCNFQYILILTTILQRGLRNCFFFPIFIWTFISHFSLDFYFPFFFGLLFSHFSLEFYFLFISLFSLDFYSIAVTFWISSKFFVIL